MQQLQTNTSKKPSDSNDSIFNESVLWVGCLPNNKQSEKWKLDLKRVSGFET